MGTEMGEYVVGAYLKLVKRCDVVDYNVRAPDGGLEGLNELDVIGFDFQQKRVYLCEVTTHIKGLNTTIIEKIEKKHHYQQEYAKKYLQEFEPIFMFWSPVVPEGGVQKLKNIEGLEVVINAEYKKRIEELRELAKKITSNVNNPFFRTLQILEHLRG